MGRLVKMWVGVKVRVTVRVRARARAIGVRALVGGLGLHDESM